MLDLLDFFEPSKVVLVNTVEFLMMTAKLANLSLLERNIFWNKGYDIITSVYDINKKNLARDSSYIVYVVMWPKFDNSSISMREVIITSIL